MIGGFLAPRRFPFLSFLILISYTDIQPLRMSTGAHDLVISSGGTFYASDTVSGTARYPPSKLIAWMQITIHNINNDNRMSSDRVIPLVPNPSNRFTGRTEIIAKLKKHFSTPANDPTWKRKFFLLHGMGGIGKTQICLKFITEMSD